MSFHDIPLISSTDFNEQKLGRMSDNGGGEQKNINNNEEEEKKKKDDGGGQINVKVKSAVFFCAEQINARTGRMARYFRPINL